MNESLVVTQACAKIEDAYDNHTISNFEVYGQHQSQKLNKELEITGFGSKDDDEPYIKSQDS
ncbi:hypothetical protein N7488_006897 [Penicillium malachiteum]|nr:hypothetical protein N7488_006897 [Penicillium malachiteum]